MVCDVMWCDVMWCDGCDWCDVMWCDAIWCDDDDMIRWWCDVTRASWRNVFCDDAVIMVCVVKQFMWWRCDVIMTCRLILGWYSDVMCYLLVLRLCYVISFKHFHIIDISGQWKLNVILGDIFITVIIDIGCSLACSYHTLTHIH